MATVQHPTFSDITHEIPKGDVSKWTKQGWKQIDSETTDPQPASTDAPAKKKPGRPAKKK